MNFCDGNIQFSQQQYGFQYGALVVVITPAAFVRIDEGGRKQPDFIVSHQSFFVDAVQCRKLADGK